MSTNINDDLNNNLLPFLEQEKTTIALKGIFQVLNTKSTLSNPNNELFSKGFNVTTSDLMTDADTIIQTLSEDDVFSNSNIKAASIAEWSDATNFTSETMDVFERLYRGKLVSEIQSDSTSNPNVEKIIMPLTKIANTNDQTYLAYAPGNDVLTANEYATQWTANPFKEGDKQVSLNTIFPNKKYRVDNWISPFKFGSGYEIKIFTSKLEPGLAGIPEPDFFGETSVGEISSDKASNKHGGWIFDYREGALLFAHQQTGLEENIGEKPDLSSYNHPLWIVGYRYTGATGSAGVGGVIDSATETDLTFDPDNIILSLGDTSVDLSSLGSSFQHLKFTKDFAREEVQFSSSIAIMHDADSDGFPYVTSSCDSWLFLNTIHLTDPNTNDYRGDHVIYGETGAPIIQFPYGYALGFSSSLNSATGSHFPNKHIPPYTAGTRMYPIKELDPHTHGFNYGYVTSSNGNRFLYDPSGKSSGSIATELRDYINNNFSDHLSASVELTSSVTLGEDKTIPLLTVKQIYYGMPSWYYTNFNGGSRFMFDNTDTPFFSSSYHNTGLPMPFTSQSFNNYLGYYITSSEGYSNATGFGSTIYPLRFVSTDFTQYETNTFASNNPWSINSGINTLVTGSNYCGYGGVLNLVKLLASHDYKSIIKSPIFPYRDTDDFEDMTERDYNYSPYFTQTTPFLTSRVTYDNSPATNNPSTGSIDLQHASITPGQQFQLNIGDVTFKYYISNLSPRSTQVRYDSSSIITPSDQFIRQIERNTVEILLNDIDSNEKLANKITRLTNKYFLSPPQKAAIKIDANSTFYVNNQSSSFTKNSTDLANDLSKFKNGVYITSSGTILSFTSSVECDPSLVNTITFKTGSDPSIISGSSGFPLAQNDYFVWAYTGSGGDNNIFPHSGLATKVTSEGLSTSPIVASSPSDRELTSSLFLASPLFLSNSLATSSHWFDNNNSTVMTMGGGTTTPLINFTEEFQKSLFHLSEKLYTGSTENNWFNSKTGTSMNRFSDDFPDNLFNRGPFFFSKRETFGWASTPWNYFGKSGSGFQPINYGTDVDTTSTITHFVRPSSTIIPKLDNQPSYYLGGSAQFRVGARAGHPFPLRDSSGPFGSFTYGWYKHTMVGAYKNAETDPRIVPYRGQMFPLTLPTGSDIRFGIVGTDIGNLPLGNGSVGQPNPNRRSIIKAYQTEMLRAGYDDIEFGLQEEDAVLQFNIAKHQIFTSGGHTVNSEGENTYPHEIQGLEDQFLRAGNQGSYEVSVNPLIVPQISTSIEIGPAGESINRVNLYEGFASTDLSSNDTMIFLGQQTKTIRDIDIISDTDPILGGDLNTNGKIIFGNGRINLLSNNSSTISNLSSSNITTTNLDVTNNLNVTNDLNIDGNLTFDGFTFSDGNISTLSGSNIFGSGSGNTHKFTGSIFTSGSITLGENNELFGTSSFSHTSSLSYGLSGSPDIIVSNITSSNISASGLLFASLSFAPLPHQKQIRSVVYDTASGQFYFTGSYGSGGGSGTGTGFPFSGSAVLTGSLIVSNSSPFIQINSSSTSFGPGKLHNRGGALYWGDVKIASGSPIGADISNIVEDSTPQLGGDLDMQSNSIKGNSNSKIILKGSDINFLSASGDNIEIFGNITQSGTSNVTFLQTTEINTSLKVNNSITASIISASGIIIASNLTGNNTGDQDLTSYIQASQTGSFVVNSQTSSFALSSTTSSFITNSQTSSFALSSTTSSFITNSQTSSFVVNSQTSSFVINSQTSSFVVNSQTSSFVVNSQTSSFVTNGTASLTNITASGNISASGNIFLQLGTFNARAKHVGYDTDTGQLVNTRIARRDRGGEFYTEIEDNWEVSGSLIVSESSKFIGSILANSNIAIGTTFTSSALNVSGNIFISNVNDANTPDTEGILIETSGENNKTVNKIFFQQKSPNASSNGIEFLHNGSTSPINSIDAGTFSITQHNDSINGSSKFSIKSDGKVGIRKSTPIYPVHIGEDTFFDNNVTLASGKSLSVGSGAVIQSSGIATNFITGLLNSNIEIGKSGGNTNTHIKNDLVVSQSATIAGRLVVGDRIVGGVGTDLILGSPEKPVKTLNIMKDTIVFYSGSSTEESSSVEIASLSINEQTSEFEFKSGSELTKVRASEINLGANPSLQSVQIGQSTQGFIAVNAEPGKFSTVFRAEHSGLSGDFRMGSITQKGSGSFAILLDADQIRPDAKFGIYSNTAIPGFTTPLITVSESFETRVHNGGLRADNYVITTNITASGNISASGTIITDTINVGNTQNVGSLNVGPSSNKIELKGGNPSLGSDPQIISTTGNIDVKDNLIVSGNISGNPVTTASFGSLQLNNLPTSPTGLPTGSVWVSGSKQDSTTNNVNCGTLMIVI